MSYARSMGTTAEDVAAITTAVGTAAAQLIAAGRTPPATDPYATAGQVPVNPATGMPYGAINPSTGLPYGQTPEVSYVPYVIGGAMLLGVGAFLVFRKK